MRPFYPLRKLCPTSNRSERWFDTVDDKTGERVLVCETCCKRLHFSRRPPEVPKDKEDRDE